MKKKLLALLLACTGLAALGGVVSWAASAPFEDSSTARSAYRVHDNAALRFHSSVPLTGLTLSAPSWSNNVGSLRLSLYKWNVSYARTLNAVPLFEESFIDYTDNETLVFDFDEKAAGEYLLYIENISENPSEPVGFWGYEKGHKNVACFMSGVPVDYCPVATLVHNGDVADPFAPLTGPVPTAGDLYAKGTFSEYALKSGDSYGTQFRSETSFAGVEVFFTKFNFRSKATLALYRWQDNYVTTVAAEPLATFSHKGNDTDGWVRLEGTFAAGEYLLAVRDITDITMAVMESTFPAVNYYYDSSRCRIGAVARLIGGSSLGTPTPPKEQTYISDDASTWVATDGLGRVVSADGTADTVREGKYVGIFFHTWHSTKMHANKTVGDVTDILAAHPDIDITDYNDPRWGNYPVYFWDEPIWGYYRSDDEWVLRKQGELLANAGIDVVFFDCTNYTEVWMEEAKTLLRVWMKARADGVRTPQVAFQLNMFNYDDAAIQLRRLYNELYGMGLYEELWFCWKGKPLVLGFPENLSKSVSPDKEIRDFFTYRCINTAQSQDKVTVRNPDTGATEVRAGNRQFTNLGYQLWNWISAYPQIVNRNPDGTPEQVAVSVAINWTKETHLTAMSNQKYGVFSRDYIASEDRYDTRENAECYGAYFEDQWQYALNIDPEFIFITGWNEWTAGRYPSYHAEYNGEVTNAFIDNFIPNRSRDIEPSKGILQDHYYYQMISFIRQYKGSAAATPSSGAVKVDAPDAIDWDAVRPVFRYYAGNVDDRSHLGYNSKTYTNRTGRNDITDSRVTYDAHNVYFMVQTAEDLTPYTDPAWMRLFIDVEGVNDGKNWESFEYVINRVSPTAKRATLERSKGGWDWEEVCPVKYTARGNTLIITVPRAAIGVDTGNEVFTLNFKWSDNMQTDGDIMDFYANGDVAPGGRFKYPFTSLVESFTAEELIPPETSENTEAPDTEPVDADPVGTEAASSVGDTVLADTASEDTAPDVTAAVTGPLSEKTALPAIPAAVGAAVAAAIVGAVLWLRRKKN